MKLLKESLGSLARVVVVAAVGVVVVSGVAQAQNVGVFVSTTTTTGDIGGLAGADAICRADGAMLFPAFAGPWVAWLSDSNENAGDRIEVPGPGGAYVRASDGTVIADDLAALTNTEAVPLVNPIDPGVGITWTGTHPTGVGASGLTGNPGGMPAEYCNDWTSAMPSSGPGLPRGVVGLPADVTDTWTFGGTATCNGVRPVYCFGRQDAAVPTAPPRALVLLAVLLMAGGGLYLHRRRQPVG